MLDKLFSVALVATAGAVAASVAAMKKRNICPSISVPARCMTTALR